MSGHVQYEGPDAKISAVTHSGAAGLRRYEWAFLPLMIAGVLGYVRIQG